MNRVTPTISQAATTCARGNTLDPQVCERARVSRDARFDGLFYIAVKTTGIFCRPVCPAPTAKAQNVVYFTSAAAASAAGFRPCLRCRPELAPRADWQHPAHTLVRQALLRIEQGVLDQHDVATLAAQIGVGERHLRRLFQQELGASPQQVALTRRLLFAKQLLHDTELSVTDVALAAGFGSLRRFNDAFHKAYAMNPSTLRREAGNRRGRNVQSAAIQLRIPYRPPYDFDALLAFLRARVLAGLEYADAHCYRRVIHQGEGQPPGWVEVRHDAANHCLRLALHQVEAHRLLAVLRAVRHLFDVDADSRVIDAHLASSEALGRWVTAYPGIRVPGAVDGFEVAMRAIIGQQVSVAAARTLLGRVIRRSGGELATPLRDDLTVCFPQPAALLAADLEGCGLTGRRVQTIRGMAAAVLAGDVSLRPGQSLSDFVRDWCRLPGIGPWTAHYLAMRVLHDPDAFPAGDLILRRALGTELSERELEKYSEPWRPWRAYAALLLWHSRG